MRRFYCSSVSLRASSRAGSACIVEYTAFEDALASGRYIRDLRLPDGAVVAMIVRGREIIPPRGSTRVEPGDHVFLVLRPGLRPLVDRVFSRRREPAPIPSEVEFPLRGDTTVGELLEFYGIELEEPLTASLHDVLVARTGDTCLGSRLQLKSIDLVVRSMEGGFVERVGLVIRPDVSTPGASSGLGDDRAQLTNTEEQ